MRFQRSRVVTHAFAGVDPRGYPHYTAAQSRAAVEHLVFGNGASTPTIVTGINSDGSLQTATVTTVALPAAAYTDVSTFEVNVKDNRQLFVHIYLKALGAAALTGVTGVIEFQDPHYPEIWIPSLEGVPRASAFAAHEYNALGVGNSFIMASREEHMHFQKARFRFRAAAGAADAATVIICTWFHDGGQSPISDATPGTIDV